MPSDDLIIANRPDGLTELQARLAECIVLEGFDKADAIRAAGYTSMGAGYSALKLGHVKEYVQELIREHLLESSITAVRTVRTLMTTAKSDYVKLEASKDVLDRAGFKPVERHAHLHGGSVSVKIDLS